MGYGTLRNPHPATTLGLPCLTHDLDSCLARRGRRPCQPGSRVFCRRKVQLLPEATAYQPGGGHLHSPFSWEEVPFGPSHPPTRVTHCLRVLQPPLRRRPNIPDGGPGWFCEKQRRKQKGAAFHGAQRGSPKQRIWGLWEHGAWIGWSNLGKTDFSREL